MENPILVTFSVIVGILSTILSAVLGWVAHAKTSKKNYKEDVEKSTTSTVQMHTDIDYIKRGIDDIKFEQRGMRTEISQLRCDLGKVEEVAKSAHKRLDEHVEKG